MPASRSGARDVPEMQTLVGQEIACRIIKLDTEKEDVVVDRRVVLEEERAKAKEEKVSGLQVGMVVHGHRAQPARLRRVHRYRRRRRHAACRRYFARAREQAGRRCSPSARKLDVKILKVDPAKKRISLG
jgi:small subunit ribosomal protein S1